MGERKSVGIFGGDTNPDVDADVIMTVATVGYADKRLEEKKVCAFAAEVEHDFPILPKLDIPQNIANYNEWVNKESEPRVKEYLSQVVRFQKEVGDIAKLLIFAEEDIAFTKGWIILDNAINRINFALGIRPKDKVPKVVTDATPNYGGAGVIWIVGGTGDLSLENENRYVNSPIRSRDCSRRIYAIESKDFAGYKGPGAYTGMSARQEGEAYIYSTFRGYPALTAGDRWIPSKPEILGYEIKDGESPKKNLRYVSIWGIIGDNTIADKTQSDYQMVYRDRYQDSSKYQQFVVGYTHGMIQAIYDVAQSEINYKGKNELYWGLPYEIGLIGKKAKDPSTTKMASCFYCALFMEANGKPASSIHLGSGESWAPAYFSKDQIDANRRINMEAEHYRDQDLTESITDCNLRWSKLCLEVLNRGAKKIQKSMLEQDHIASFEAFLSYLEKNNDATSAANLVLDSATVHQKINIRVVRTIKAPSQ